MTLTARLTACALLLAAAPVAAQNFPVKPVRLIVPLAPGGGVDTVARAVANKMSQTMGQSVVVDNRPGAGGSVGAEITVRAAPDGYTIMMASATSVTYPLLYSVRYDPLKDLTPITQVSANPYVVIVHPSVPARTVKELVAHARANPGTLNYASSGNGGLPHLTGELFQSMSGTRLVHIPYKGLALAFADLFAGQVQIAFPAPITIMAHIKSGKVRPLGVTSRSRAPALPDVPTVHEGGLPGFEVTQWYGILGPAGMNAALSQRLQSEVASALRQADVATRLTADGSAPVGSTPAEFASHIKAETAKWAEVIRKANLRGQ